MSKCNTKKSLISYLKLKLLTRRKVQRVLEIKKEMNKEILTCIHIHHLDTCLNKIFVDEVNVTLLQNKSFDEIPLQSL